MWAGHPESVQGGVHQRLQIRGQHCYGGWEKGHLVTFDPVDRWRSCNNGPGFLNDCKDRRKDACEGDLEVFGERVCIEAWEKPEVDWHWGKRN